MRKVFIIGFLILFIGGVLGIIFLLPDDNSFKLPEINLSNIKLPEFKLENSSNIDSQNDILPNIDEKQLVLTDEEAKDLVSKWEKEGLDSKEIVHKLTTEYGFTKFAIINDKLYFGKDYDYYAKLDEELSHVFDDAPPVESIENKTEKIEEVEPKKETSLNQKTDEIKKNKSEIEQEIQDDIIISLFGYEFANNNINEYKDVNSENTKLKNIEDISTIYFDDANKQIWYFDSDLSVTFIYPQHTKNKKLKPYNESKDYIWSWVTSTLEGNYLDINNGNVQFLINTNKIIGAEVEKNGEINIYTEYDIISPYNNFYNEGSLKNTEKEIKMNEFTVTDDNIKRGWFYKDKIHIIHGEEMDYGEPYKKVY